jgi:thioester reductase-like protein
MTGFPGFLGSALLPRLLARGPDERAICLVQHRHLLEARSRAKDLEAQHPGVWERIQILTGDVSEPDLALDRAGRAAVREATQVWHLASVYKLTVSATVAQQVNVDGTAMVVDLCRELPRLERLHHVSTCYVSGRYDGVFTEDALDEGQTFRNHYESTKFEAELIVRKAMADGLPATVYRPGLVVGDSVTGATDTYDGPYFLAAFLRRQQAIPLVGLPLPGRLPALVPAVGDVDRVKVGLAPRDFVVDAMDRLSATNASLGRTYALTDPHPPTVRELVDTFAARLGKRVLWARVPLAPTRAFVGRLPGMEALLGLPAEALEYLASPTTYVTGHATADLAGTGVECPPFSTYADRLVDFMLANPKVGSA